MNIECIVYICMFGPISDHGGMLRIGDPEVWPDICPDRQTQESQMD
jgi:hypothetical protein